MKPSVRTSQRTTLLLHNHKQSFDAAVSLGAFAKLRKATMSLVMYVRQHGDKSAPTGWSFMKFMKFDIWGFF
jgi:hypothetical protein